MNKLAYTAFVAFWASVGTVLSLDYLMPERVEAGDSALPTFTLEEVSGHADEKSCWMAIEGSVYDLTGYVSRHPAPRVVILEWCGREATEGMRTKGYGPDHSAAAWAMLEKFLIGKLTE